ncbi:MAG: hypothetical protein FWB86_08100 [Treponema sp.]|nr:hypothetical protein [Treponema sp.]MCL2251945.1 hypothetical protein [Treponema sp.]
MKNKITIIRFLFILLIISMIIIMSVSCSRTKPEIAFGFIQLVLYQGTPDPVQHFSFFIIPEDTDGIENLDELYLFHDKEQLRWMINKDDWVTHTHEGKEWIGTRSLAIKDGELPKGVFRAVLVNKGGESSERSFTYDGNVRFPFPELEITGGYYTVKSEWPVNRLVCYDRTGNYNSTVVLNSLSGSISQLRLSQSITTAALWAEDENNFCSAFTNAVSINQ